MGKSVNQGLAGNDPNSKLADYLMLRIETDLLCKRLTGTYNVHLKCAPGCHKCCMDFSIFPVEFFSILKENGNKKINIRSAAAEGECLFLIDGLCSIFELRPIICRTHGLPMLVMGEDDWELSYCELNFTSGDLPEFGESNTYPQDLYNSKLFLINREFVKSREDRRYSETDLLSLRELAFCIPRTASPSPRTTNNSSNH
jgi:Fe-S-cluster containining protein